MIQKLLRERWRKVGRELREVLKTVLLRRWKDCCSTKRTKKCSYPIQKGCICVLFISRNAGINKLDDIMVKQPHIVARFYLEYFIAKNGKLNIFDSITKNEFSAKPLTTARIGGFYDIAEIEHPENKQIIEDNN